MVLVLKSLLLQLDLEVWGRFKTDKRKDSFSQHPANALPHITAAVNTGVMAVQVPGNPFQPDNNSA